MAKSWDSTKLKIVLLTDIETSEGSGKFKSKSKSYSNVAENSTADDLYEVAKGISLLQKYRLVEVQQIDTHILDEN